MTVHLDGPGVTIADVVAVARDREPVELTEAALGRMAGSRRVVDELASGTAVYGISTGFGALANTQIPPERRAALQRALIRSHAAGMGEPHGRIRFCGEHLGRVSRGMEGAMESGERVAAEILSL